MSRKNYVMFENWTLTLIVLGGLSGLCFVVGGFDSWYHSDPAMGLSYDECRARELLQEYSDAAETEEFEAGYIVGPVKRKKESDFGVVAIRVMVDGSAFVTLGKVAPYQQFRRGESVRVTIHPMRSVCKKTPTVPPPAAPTAKK